MKVALCISGLPRAVEKCYENLYVNFLSPYQPDIFMYFWKENVEVRVEAPVKDFEDQIWRAKTLYPAVNCQVVEKPPRLLADYFKKHGFDKDERGAVWKTKRRHCLSMYKAIYECNCLKVQHEAQNQFKYDFVIRARTDVSLRINKLHQQISMSKKYITIPHRSDTLVKGGYGDEYAWGSSDAMDYYSSLYLSFREYQKNVKTFWNAHQMLKAHLDAGPHPVRTMQNVDLRRRV
jgi:hypothetical protein